MLAPDGPAARSIAGLWWPMLAAATVVFAFVAGMLLLAAVRGRRKTEDEATAHAGTPENPRRRGPPTS